MKKTAATLFLFTIVYCLLSNRMVAQQLSLSNPYVINKFSLSPAYAGAGDNFEAFGTYRRDWMGISGAPETKSVFADGLIYKNMGLGGNVTSQQAGIFTNISANLSYAYHVHLSGFHFLSFGIGVGVLENHLDLSSKGAQDDPVALNANRTSSLFTASFGILYHNRVLDIGFSAPQFLMNKTMDTHLYYLTPQYQGHISYKVAFNKSWAIDPTAIVAMPQNAPMHYELAIPIMFQNKIWLTPAYKNSSIAVGVGARLCTNFVFNYSYEFSSMGIAAQSSGTHEITIGWRFNKKKTDEPTPDAKKPYYKWLGK